MEFAIQMLMSYLGVLFVIWLRAFLSVKAVKEATWDWNTFIMGNLPKFVLAFVGVTIISIAMYNDAAGVQSVLERFNVPVQGAAGFSMGATVAAFLLVVPDLDKLVSAVLITSVCIVTMACPASKANIEKAYSTAEGMYITVEEAAHNVLALYEAKIITYELKERIVAGMRKSKDGVDRFKGLVDAFYAIEKTRNVPDDVLSGWDVYVSTEVAQPISDLLVDIKLLTPENQQKVLTAIVLVRQAILTIMNIFVRARGRASVNFEFYTREKEMLVYAE